MQMEELEGENAALRQRKWKAEAVQDADSIVCEFKMNEVVHDEAVVKDAFVCLLEQLKLVKERITP
jgi:hypothetical protein